MHRPGREHPLRSSLIRSLALLGMTVGHPTPLAHWPTGPLAAYGVTFTLAVAVVCGMKPDTAAEMAEPPGATGRIATPPVATEVGEL